jgi:protoporphyrinogen/coproporphyrinogen III oxidase
MTADANLLTVDALIVGAGISGLAAATQLHDLGRTVLVLEAKATAGGCLQSQHLANGALVEAGPNSFPGSSQALIAWAERLRVPLEEANPTQKYRYVYWKQRLMPVPMGPWQALQTPLLSWRGKLRVLQEPFRSVFSVTTSSGVACEASVAQWIKHRLGSEVLERLVAPFLTGIYAGDVEALSASAVFPRLVALEQTHGSVIRGFLAQKRQAKEALADSANSKQSVKRSGLTLYNCQGGMNRLMQAAVAALPQKSLLCGQSVQTLHWNRALQVWTVQTQQGDSFQAKQLLLATPAYVSAALLKSLAPQAAQALSAIPYAPIAVGHFLFPDSELLHPLNGFGYLVPRGQGLSTLGSIWSSALFPERCPPGYRLLSVFLGGQHHPQLVTEPEEALNPLVLGELRQTLGLPKIPQPTEVTWFRWPRTIPQYTLGHCQRIAQAVEALKELPVALLGNYLQGINLNTCVQSAQTVARSLLFDTPPNF